MRVSHLNRKDQRIILRDKSAESLKPFSLRWTPPLNQQNSDAEALRKIPYSPRLQSGDPGGHNGVEAAVRPQRSAQDGGLF
jgi:hypothetical protein